MSEINPEHVSTIRYAVKGLLQGLDECKSSITFDEQATALEQFAADLRQRSLLVREIALRSKVAA